jgi:hypothetical protein
MPFSHLICFFSCSYIRQRKALSLCHYPAAFEGKGRVSFHLLYSFLLGFVLSMSFIVVPVPLAAFRGNEQILLGVWSHSLFILQLLLQADDEVQKQICQYKM